MGQGRARRLRSFATLSEIGQEAISRGEEFDLNVHALASCHRMWRYALRISAWRIGALSFPGRQTTRPLSREGGVALGVPRSPNDRGGFAAAPGLLAAASVVGREAVRGFARKGRQSRPRKSAADPPAGVDHVVCFRLAYGRGRGRRRRRIASDRRIPLRRLRALGRGHGVLRGRDRRSSWRADQGRPGVLKIDDHRRRPQRTSAQPRIRHG